MAVTLDACSASIALGDDITHGDVFMTSDNKVFVWSQEV